MAEDEKFEQHIEGVFEHRAREFSPQLRALLEELWLEGVRHGRLLERLETHEFFKKELPGTRGRPAAGVDLAQGPDVTVVSEMKIGPNGNLELKNFTLEDVARAVDRLGPRPAPGLLERDPRWRMEHELLQEQMFKETQLWSATTLEKEIEEQYFKNGRLLQEASSIPERRELYGTWSGTDEEACPSSSHRMPSRNSPSSSTPASSSYFGTGSRGRGASGRS